MIVIVMELESRVLVVCSLDCGEVDKRSFGDVIRVDDGPCVLLCLEMGGFYLSSPMRRGERWG